MLLKKNAQSTLLLCKEGIQTSVEFDGSTPRPHQAIDFKHGLARKGVQSASPACNPCHYYETLRSKPSPCPRRHVCGCSGLLSPRPTCAPHLYPPALSRPVPLPSFLPSVSDIVAFAEHSVSAQDPFSMASCTEYLVTLSSTMCMLPSRRRITRVAVCRGDGRAVD